MADFEDEEVPRVKKYERGDKLKDTSRIWDRKLRGHLIRSEAKRERAAERSAKLETFLEDEPGFLEPEGLERTHKFSQKAIVESVDATTARKHFELKLDKLGPYKMSYTRNGRHLLIGGRKGHVATMDWMEKRLGAEFQVQETIKDVKYLHNETMFAVAQKKYVHIYDNTGVELHCLRRQRHVHMLDFLPYHFLLVTASEDGWLRYQDTSTGTLVVQYKTKKGRSDSMVHNPYNAITLLGQHNGVVSMWSPNSGAPLVKMLCHRGPVKSIAVDKEGRYLASSGLDGSMKVWDVRTYKLLYQYQRQRPAQCLHFSQRGLLAAGNGHDVNVWKDVYREKQKMPYMSHHLPHSAVEQFEFCPFEDVLGVGHGLGFVSLLIPGAGEPNYDALELNPHQTKKQRQEAEVKGLLEKIQPDLISLDPFQIVKVNKKGAKDEEVEEEKEDRFHPRYRKKGRSGARKVYGRKQGMILESKRKKRQEEVRERQKESRKQTIEKRRVIASALDRFT